MLKRPASMLSAPAMIQVGEAALAEPAKFHMGRPSSLAGLSSAPTQCPSSELLTFDDWDSAALPKGGDELALLDPALLEPALLEPVVYPPRNWRAAPAPKEAPLRRLRSEAYWGQKAADSQKPRCSPCKVGVRQRSTYLEEDEEEDLPVAAAAPTPAAEDAAGGCEGATGGPKSLAGAISRELRRGARGAPSPAPPLRPRAPAAAAPKSRGRPCRFA